LPFESLPGVPPSIAPAEPRYVDLHGRSRLAKVFIGGRDVKKSFAWGVLRALAHPRSGTAVPFRRTSQGLQFH
jgi:hypothetical protein